MTVSGRAKCTPPQSAHAGATNLAPGVVKHIVARPTGLETPIVAALLVKRADKLERTSRFDVALMCAQEQYELWLQALERRAHLLHDRVRAIYANRQSSNFLCGLQCAHFPDLPVQQVSTALAAVSDSDVFGHCRRQASLLTDSWVFPQLRNKHAGEQSAAAAIEYLRPWLQANHRIEHLPEEAVEHLLAMVAWRLACQGEDEIIRYVRTVVECARRQWKYAHTIRKVGYLCTC